MVEEKLSCCWQTHRLKDVVGRYGSRNNCIKVKDFYSCFFFLINYSISIFKTTLSCDNFSHLACMLSDILMKTRNKAENEKPVRSRPGFMANSWSTVLCAELETGSWNCEKWWVLPADGNINVNKLTHTLLTPYYKTVKIQEPQTEQMPANKQEWGWPNFLSHFISATEIELYIEFVHQIALHWM